MTDGGTRSSGAPGTCLLQIGEHVVVRAIGIPDAEYALFEIGEIELRAGEPGRVREHGYQTTAGAARARLTQLGMTPAVAEELGRAMQPVLSDAYARGPAVRRVARYLGPAELFQSDRFDGASHVYLGVFLDLATMVRDLGMEHASATFQALFLATLIEAVPDETLVVLSTEACTRDGKPGARTWRRPNFADPRRLLNALGGLAHKSPKPEIQDQLPRQQVVAFLRARAAHASDEDARALYKALESSVAIRDMPEKGPLASPELWAVETRMDRGDLSGTLETIEEIERRHGRTPGTTYLRSRASLALGVEPARLIAERVSALALSMTSFQELALLAAEAWLEAGDPRRALPYARDLVNAPGVDEVLLRRAQRMLAASESMVPSALELGAEPTRTPSLFSPRVSTAPVPMQRVHASDRPASGRDGELDDAFQPNFLVPVPSSMPAAPPLPSAPPPRSSVGAGSLASRPPGSRAPAATLDVPPPPRRPMDLDPPLLEPLSPPPPPVEAHSSASTAPSSKPAPEARPGSRRPRLSGVLMETRPPTSFDPRAEPDTPRAPRTQSSAFQPAPRTSSAARRLSPAPFLEPPDLEPPRPRPARPPSGRSHDDASSLGPAVLATREGPFMHGASLPPFRHEHPAPLLASAPLLPRLASDELAEHLALPPGLGADQRPTEALPTSVLEARVQFTLLARELGLDYRLKRGIELRADLSGIEAMQAVLLESFPDHVVRSPEEAYELRRHGALLSEILCRTLDAEWLDIAPSELGYWVMIVPPDTRVWPFGRIARLVAMGHKERDLVSYYLELQSRARPR